MKAGDTVVCKMESGEGLFGNVYKGDDKLKLNQEYVVERVQMHSWHTQVYLVGFGDIGFSSCQFKDKGHG